MRRTLSRKAYAGMVGGIVLGGFLSLLIAWAAGWASSLVWLPLIALICLVLMLPLALVGAWLGNGRKPL